MSIEHGSQVEMNIATKDQTIEAILKNFPNYEKEDLDKPIGTEGTSLNEFLDNKNEGSEWKDPHGFKINVVAGEYKISF